MKVALRSDGITHLADHHGTEFERVGSTLFIGHQHMAGFHATVSDPNTKTVAATNAEYAITFDDQAVLDEIGHTPGDSKLYSLRSSAYLIAVSAIIDITAPPAAYLDLWLKKNGVNCPNSNTQVQIASAAVQQTLAVAFVVDLAVGEYAELFYHGTTTNVRLLAIAAQAGPPVIPAAPSIVVSIARVGEPAWED